MLFMNLDALEFNAYIFRIVMPSLLIVLLIRMKCLSLSVLINFGLKQIPFSDVMIVEPGCFMVPVA